MLDGFVEFSLGELPLVLLHFGIEIGEGVNILVAERILRRIGIPATYQITDRALRDVAEAVVEGEAVDAVVVVCGPGHIASAKHGERVIDGVL